MSFWDLFATKMSDEDFLKLCKTGSAEDIKDAINAGADVNTKDTRNITALMYAARYNNDPEVITVLAKAGAD